MTPRVTLIARKRSRIKAGTGTSITNTVATVATGMSHSAEEFFLLTIVSAATGIVTSLLFWKAWDRKPIAYAPARDRERQEFPRRRHRVSEESSDRCPPLCKVLGREADFQRWECRSTAQARCFFV